jgi:hypothetical protein
VTVLWNALYFAYIFRERLSVSKPAKQKLDVERLNLKNRSALEIKEQYRV